MLFVAEVQNVGTRTEPDHSTSLALNVGKMLLYLLSVYLQVIWHLLCQYSEPSLLEVEAEHACCSHFVFVITELNGTYQLSVYADDLIILGRTYILQRKMQKL